MSFLRYNLNILLLRTEVRLLKINLHYQVFKEQNLRDFNDLSKLSKMAMM